MLDRTTRHGALEFEPSTGANAAQDKLVKITEMIDLAVLAFADKEHFNTQRATGQEEQALLDIISVGASPTNNCS